MEQYRKTVITFVVLIVVLFGLYSFSGWFSRTTGYVLGEDQKMALATCLGSRGATLYTSNTCPDCEAQLEMFGPEATKELNIFNCFNPNECPEGGVPAWQIGKQTIYGVKSFEELIEISGCEING